MYYYFINSLLNVTLSILYELRTNSNQILKY